MGRQEQVRPDVRQNWPAFPPPCPRRGIWLLWSTPNRKARAAAPCSLSDLVSSGHTPTARAGGKGIIERPIARLNLPATRSEPRCARDTVYWRKDRAYAHDNSFAHICTAHSHSLNERIPHRVWWFDLANPQSYSKLSAGMANSSEPERIARTKRVLFKCVFDENADTLGYAPMWVPKGREFVTWDAQYRFWQAVHRHANQTNERLLEVWEANGGEVPQAELNGWAEQFHLLYQGRPAEWVMNAARLAVFQWQVADTEDRLRAEREGRREIERRPKTPILMPVFAPTGALAVTNDECRIDLPPVAWHPLQVSKLPGGDRALTKAQFRGAVVKLLDKELDRIEALAKMRGAIPVPTNRCPEHFEWAVRFQVNEERITTMALAGGSKGVEARERKMRKAIDEVLSWLRLDKRRDPGGRPRK